MRHQARGWTGSAEAFARETACPRVLLGALHEPYANVALLLGAGPGARVVPGRQFGWAALTVEYDQDGRRCAAITLRTGPQEVEERIRVLAAAGVATYAAEWDWPSTRVSLSPRLRLLVAPPGLEAETAH
jgi:hypothetical protein